MKIHDINRRSKYIIFRYDIRPYKNKFYKFLPYIDYSKLTWRIVDKHFPSREMKFKEFRRYSKRDTIIGKRKKRCK